MYLEDKRRRHVWSYRTPAELRPADAETLADSFRANGFVSLHGAMPVAWVDACAEA